MTYILNFYYFKELKKSLFYKYEDKNFIMTKDFKNTLKQSIVHINKNKIIFYLSIEELT